MELYLDVLKEPRGFIRVVQFVMSIFAFSTTAGFSGTTSFSMDCPDALGSSSSNTADLPITINFGYPFKVITFTKSTAPCTKELNDLKYHYNFSSSAEFFVTTGVLAFLYTMGISAVYILLNRMYTSNQLVPIVDLGVTGVFTLFWLAGSSAWAQGVSDVKYFTKPSTFIARLKTCQSVTGEGASCVPGMEGNYASLNVSLILGFANALLWAASMWFVYKETTFHAQREQAMQPPQQVPPMQPQTQSPPSGVQSPDAYKY